ncbi:hypothetical protein N7495_008093 [Penicillium taxi]|uniref:uncharacterized protein n=1 Tax=Penicillium taxi TaxID=168475 RepID=UPI002545B43D|nr:uncharacterized protein N7495_008093 [Penicillium taxi]KAJ5888052.1 hypothetical protein N7495_008093 [Penicillium taxi]
MSQNLSTPPPPSPSKLRVPRAPRHGHGYEDSEPYPTRHSARIASRRALQAADRGSPQPRDFSPDEDKNVFLVEALPTPTKTPAKKVSAPSEWSIGPSIDRSLFRSEKRMALARGSEKLEIFTDSRDRIPEVSLDARNPFAKTGRPSDGEASTVSRQTRSTVRGKDSSFQDDDDDVKYMFRGKQVRRPAQLSDYDSDEDEDDDEEYLGLFASRRDLLPDLAKSKWKGLRRRDVKPKMLWPQDPSQKDTNDDSLFTPKSSSKDEARKKIVDESEQSATRAHSVTRRGTRGTEMDTVIEDKGSDIQSRNPPNAEASSSRSLRPNRGSKGDSHDRQQMDGAGDLPPDSPIHSTQGHSKIDGAGDSPPGPIRSSPFKKWLRKKNGSKEMATTSLKRAASGEDGVPTKRTRATRKDL